MKETVAITTETEPMARFRRPRASSRPAPLWNWNGKITREFVQRELRRLSEEGFGGVFVHARPGLRTEYLSDDWFDRWQDALDTAKSLGLECHIYDENSFPSGFAGGHVFSRFPFGAAQYAVPIETQRLPEQPDCNVLAVFDLSSGQPQQTNFEGGREGQFLLIELRKGRVHPWTAWAPFVDTCNPHVTAHFLETTHEAYRERFGDRFGQDIRYCFTDEPTAAKFEQFDRLSRLPMSRLLLMEFQREHGYDLIPRLIDLFQDSDTSSGTRFDFYLTLQRVWCQNYLRPISEWCERNQLDYTGHLMEHEWPLPLSHPNTMDALRWFHAPGIDMLAFQFNFDHRRENARYLLNVKEAASVADQMGRERVLSETHGAGGHTVRFTRFKQLCDWQMVHGINLVNPHMASQSLAGARKFDWPQTYSDHSPWFAHYRIHAEHTARLTEALRLGRRENRVLLLHPTTSAWLDYTPGVNRHTFGADFRHTQATLAELLADSQIDFDLGDEQLMRDPGHVRDGQMVIGERAYSVMVLPEGMDNWLGSTLDRLTRFLETGGTLLALRQPPTRVNGRLDPAPAELRARHPEHWIEVADRQECVTAIRGLVEPRVAAPDGQPLDPAINHQYQTLPGGGALHFFVNTENQPIATTVAVAGAEAIELDTATGAATTCLATRDQGRLIIEHAFPAYGHWIFVVDAGWDAPVAPSPATNARPAEARFVGAEASEPNACPLLYGDIELPSGEILTDLNIMEANEKLWEVQGFDSNIWDRAVQFRDNYSRFTFDEQSAFRVRYRFHAESVPTDLSLALERPELYQCSVNGHLVDFSAAPTWLDDEILRADIAAFVAPGENVIELAAAQFDVLCEIDRIYLLGAFTLQPAEQGFSLHAGTPELTLGDWAPQGMPFYRGTIRYRYQITVPEGARSLRVGVPGYAGALAVVECDGQAFGHAAFAPYQAEGPAPAPGEHEITIEVVSDLRNLMGPYFGGNQPSQYWAWRAAPAHTPPGADFLPQAQGLMQEPIVEALD